MSTTIIVTEDNTTIIIHECLLSHTTYNNKLMIIQNLDQLLTLGAHAQRGLQYLVCVCVCVCVSVTQHLTFHVIIRTTNGTNLLSGG